VKKIEGMDLNIQTNMRFNVREIASSARKGPQRDRILGGAADFVYTMFVCEGTPFRIVCSGACERVTGYTQAEMESDRDLWLKVVPDEERGIVLSRNVRLFSGERPETIEHKIIRKDGKVRWVESASVPVYNNAGRELLYDFIIKDITDEKAKGEGLELRREWITGILDALDEGVFLVNVDGIVSEVNSASLRIFRLRREEIVGKPFFLPWDDEGDCGGASGVRKETDVSVAIRERGELSDYVYEMMVPGMPVSWIRVNAKHLDAGEDDNGDVIVTFTDVTWMVERDMEERRLRKELEACKKKLPVGYITMCSNCRKIRNAGGEWVQMESFFTNLTGVEFSHGVCPGCGFAMYGDLYGEIE
jgi:PAS domain S-box-containing protein